MKRLLVIALLVFAVGWLWSHRERSHPPGVTIDSTPLQRPAASASELEKNGYRIEPLERFEVEARVLSTTTYRLDREADLAPVDLALGWGPMSDTAVLDKISISQSGRFYFWHVDEFPIPRREIEINSANMHMIPASSTIERKLKSISRGQIVSISGYLVEAKASDGWRWRSSLTRDDTGQGACELVWVEDIAVH